MAQAGSGRGDLRFRARWSLLSPVSPKDPLTAARIAVLSPLAIDQIAAGEVVERPASVVKELVDNAIDAGGSRIDVELEDGGVTRISVRDNGRGIHPDDLLLAVTRHATSKLRDPSELTDINTLGFRGEALASVAAVARVDLRSRQPHAAVGVHLHARPGEPPRLAPAGMPVGTQVEVHNLFANLPARRKFMRAEATEVGQCSETVLRLAIVHPEVHFTMRHGRRELLALPRATTGERVAQVLGRRAAGPLFAFSGEEDGVAVQVWLPTPEAASRGRGGPYLIVRRRVVRERSLGQIVAQAYGLTGEATACVWVEPPRASVDVNVHPQKSEVRFSDPQRVYAAVRRVLAAAMAAAPWAGAVKEAGEARGPAWPPVGMLAGGEVSEGTGSAGAQTVRGGGGRAQEESARDAESERDERRGPGFGAGPMPVGFVSAEAGALDAAEVRRAAARAAEGRRDARLSEAAGAGERGGAGLSEETGERRTGSGAEARRAAGLSEAAGEAMRERAAAGLSGWEGDEDDEAGLSEAAGERRDEAAGRLSEGAGERDGGAAGSSEWEGDEDDAAGLPEGVGERRGVGLSEGAGERRAAGLSGGTGERAAGLSEGTGERRAASAGTGERRDGAEGGRAAGLSGAAEDAGLSGGTGPTEASERAARAGGYRLATRALAADYDEHKRGVIAAAAALRPAEARSEVAAEPSREPREPEGGLFAPALLGLGAEETAAPVAAREVTGPRTAGPEFLLCLPGPVAVFAERDALLAIDLRRLRSHLVYLRLQRDLIGRRGVAIQGLLNPAVVHRAAEEVGLIMAAQAELRTLGVDVDRFGDDAVLVRGVPAHLRHCVDDADVGDLVARIVPWLRIRSREADAAAVERGLIGAIATTHGSDPAPRLARRWLAELVEAGATLAEVPGLRRWTAAALLGSRPSGPESGDVRGRSVGAAAVQRGDGAPV